PSEFGADVTSFISRVRESGAIPVLQTPPAIDLLHAPDRARIGAFAKAIREVAAREDAILVDQHAVFTSFSVGTGPGNEEMPWGLLDDAFHPNAAGHSAIALELARELGLDAKGTRVMTDLAARVAMARHPHWGEVDAS